MQAKFTLPTSKTKTSPDTQSQTRLDKNPRKSEKAAAEEILKEVKNVFDKFRMKH